MKRYDKIRLGSGASLIIGHRPDSLPLYMVGNSEVAHKDAGMDTNQFGLFETAAPNFNTYYPDVKADDLKIDDADLARPIFRLLSETIVHKQHNPIDFSQNNVLKNSMSKLIGQTVYANHEAMIGNELGTISNVVWQESYKTKNGIVVPAGINGEFVIDAKSNPKIVRGIMMKPPSIHSNSVTVQFAWEQSHPKMDNDEFWNKLGTFDEEGELIRRVVTDIIAFHETSLVSHGADPWAQVLDEDGKINNPDYANDTHSLSESLSKTPLLYGLNFKNDIASLSNEQTTPLNSNNINTTQMKKLIAQLAKKLNKPESEITEKFIQDHLISLEASAEELESTKIDLGTAQTDLSTEKETVTRLTGELETANTSVTDLGKDKEALEGTVTELKETAKTKLTELRDEAVRTYNLLKGDEADEAKLTLIGKMDEESLIVELKQNNEELDKAFPGTCNDCNSNNVSRNSTKLGDADKDKKKPGTKLTNEQVNAALIADSKTGYIFDKDKD